MLTRLAFKEKIIFLSPTLPHLYKSVLIYAVKALMTYQEFISKPEYSFLQTNPHIHGRLLFLCIAGSRAYGTNVEGSDIDLRGVVLDDLPTILGIEPFEQYQDESTDSVIFGLSRFFNLARAGNPAIIELLFLRKEDYLYISPLGQILLDNRDAFLSTRVIATYTGFANSQLNRLDNALISKDKALTELEKLQHIQRSVENTIGSFTIKEEENGTIHTYVDESSMSIKADINLKAFPLPRLKKLGDAIGDVMQSYGKKHRNQTKQAPKDDAHLNKHMLHLIRLYVTLIDLLETGELHVYREKEHDLLMDIRSGKYRDENGGVSKEFRKMVATYQLKISQLKKNTTLKESVDADAINHMLLDIYRQGGIS